MKLVRCLDNVAGGRERQLHPIVQTYCIEAGQLENLDYSFTREGLEQCLHTHYMIGAPDFLDDYLDSDTMAIGALYIAIDWSNDSYQVFRMKAD